MKYIGEYVAPWFDGFTWDHGKFTRCPVKQLDDYLTCLHYEPINTIEWDCIHANGDICKYEVAK